MPTHVTLEGEPLSFDEPDDLAAFLARVQQAASDPSVSEEAMTLLVYGPGNPLLAHHLLPGRSMVTAETL